MNQIDPYAFLRAAFAAGCRVQAWHLNEGATNSNDGRWDTRMPPEGREPEFGCEPHLYRVHPEDQARAPVETVPLKHFQQMGAICHDLTVTMQAAWIQWQHGLGAEEAMKWIHNRLWGPGLIPDESEPYGKDAQAYYDANRSDPFPQCGCGRPSNILWMGKGFCCQEHYAVAKAAHSQQQAQAGDANA